MGAATDLVILRDYPHQSATPTQRQLDEMIGDKKEK
jgi:hypothetical protein